MRFKRARALYAKEGKRAAKLSNRERREENARSVTMVMTEITGAKSRLK